MRDHETRVTQKGQVTIPLDIRRKLGLKPKDVVRFEVERDGVKLTLAPSKVLASFGAVEPLARPEDWQAVRREMEERMAEDVSREDRSR